ncbi:8112_t:CDS:2 [Rhizophagus irregularis]|nr:8112_t:CDS:2 [Rhizophagus irregularis]
MNLIDLLYKHRRSEPTILLGLKLFTMIILMACLTGYLVVVIIDVKQDSPIIATSFNNVDAVPLPATISASQAVINFIVIVDGNIRAVECSLEDTKVYYDETTKAYFGVYTPSPNVLFNDLMKSLLLILTINEDFTPGITQEMTLHAFDSEYDIYYKNLSELSVYDNSILTLNRYSVEPSQIYDFTYSRVIRELIKPNWMNDFGVPPTYEQKSNIESTLHSSLISFIIQPKSKNVIRIDKEVRSKTYLSGLGLIGGAWGLMAAVYAFLFGANTLRPWGAVQSYCCGFSRSTQKKLKDALPIIPFFDTTHNDNFKNYSPDRELSLAERNELRISGLELFLQEYVVDVHYLDGIRKTTLNSTTNTINDQEAQNMKEEFDNINTNTTHSTESTVTQQQEGFVPPNFTQNSTSNNFTSVKYD